jgi:PST family polysaccharide transporter
VVRTGQLGTWLITIFVMRLLSPVDYGLMGLATILLGFFGLINELGAIPAIIQRRQVDQRLGPTWHDAAMVLQIIALGVPHRALALFV